VSSMLTRSAAPLPSSVRYHSSRGFRFRFSQARASGSIDPDADARGMSSARSGYFSRIITSSMVYVLVGSHSGYCEAERTGSVIRAAGPHDRQEQRKVVREHEPRA